MTHAGTPVTRADTPGPSGVPGSRMPVRPPEGPDECAHPHSPNMRIHAHVHAHAHARPGGMGLPFISSFNHSSIARVRKFCSCPRGKEKATGVLRAAKRRLWLAGVRAAFARAARARVCRPASPCSRSASRSCRCAAVCGSQQHVVPPMVQCCAMWCKCGLCGAGRARTMGEP